MRTVLLVMLLACKKDTGSPAPTPAPTLASASPSASPAEPKNQVEIYVEGMKSPATISIDMPATWQSDLRNGEQFYTVPGAMLVGLDGFRISGDGAAQMTEALKHVYEEAQFKREDLPGGRVWASLPAPAGTTQMASLLVPFHGGIIEGRVGAKTQATVDEVKAVFATIKIITPPE